MVMEFLKLSDETKKEGNLMYKIRTKRILDLFLAITLSVILFIPLLIIAILIKLTSKGSILFVQERYGKNSQPFQLYKFRSMVENTPEIANSDFSDIKKYVTPFGMFIRKTSIDELPQLWNIIKGDMSFIGPRPLANTDEKVLTLRRQNGADRILPGISGLAQVNGRNKLSDKDKAAYDGKYAAHVSFRVDLLLVCETFISVFKRDGIFNEKVVDGEINKEIIKREKFF